MDLGLRGKTAIVTGASMGIGLGIAQSLAGEGMNLVVNARRAAPLEEAAAGLRKAGVEVLAVAADVNEPGGAETIAAQAEKRFGRVDALVNNAGGFYNGSVMTLNEDEWHEAFNFNVLSIARLAKLTVPLMEGRAGRIVNVSSIAGLQLGFSFAYSVTKSAAIALTKQMSEQLAPRGITVNCLCPGLVRTPAWEPWAEEKAAGLGIGVDDFFAQQAEPVPLKRWGTIEEVGDLVAFLVSGRAGYITGSTITIDGGFVRAHHV